MREHGRRALAIAERLQALGLPVVYPGLPDHPQHTLLNQFVDFLIAETITSCLASQILLRITLQEAQQPG